MMRILSWERMTLVSLFFVAAGCGTGQLLAPDQVFLLKGKEDPRYPRVRLQAAYKGPLVVRDGCIYLDEALALFPDSYALWIKQGRVIGIRDDITQRVIRFGEVTTFSGGEGIRADAALPCTGRVIALELTR